ncbi:uncharacterized protein TNCV_1224891 [Trichonephila clavipes]|nr:uncharacterized protein TNCV_1224891 [Trichonephila clavipes]
MQDQLWESCGSVVSPDDLCWSLICLHRLSGSSVFSSGREDLRCRRLMLVSCHLCDVITWWEQKLSALKIVVLSSRGGIKSIAIDQWTPKTFWGDRLHIKPLDSYTKRNTGGYQDDGNTRE